MKKLIAISSFGMMAAFAIALANADETTVTNTTQDSYSIDRGQEAGTASNRGMLGNEPNPGNPTLGSPMTGNPELNKSVASTCTDRNGVTYSRGKDGFQGCLDSKRKSMNETYDATTRSSS